LALRGLSAHSFQIKLVAAALTAQLAMLGLLIWQGWNLMDSQLREVLRGSIEKNNTLLVAALGSPLAQRDYAAVGDLLKELVDRKMLDYIVVEDHRQRRVAATGWPAEQALPEASQGIESARSGQLHVRQKIAFSGEQLGEVQYGLSLGFLNKARTMLAGDMLRIGAVGIVFGLALLVLLTLWLLRRLSVLEQAAQRFADGDLGQRIALSGNDELTRLAGAFNNMVISDNISVIRNDHPGAESGICIVSNIRITKKLPERGKKIIIPARPHRKFRPDMNYTMDGFLCSRSEIRA